VTLTLITGNPRERAKEKAKTKEKLNPKYFFHV
jgi:hypothetical protein